MIDITHKKLRKKYVDSATAAKCIQNGMTLAIGGYTFCGYPKKILDELILRKKNGEALQFNIVSGAQIGADYMDLLAEYQLVKRYTPLIGGAKMAQAINQGEISYIEQQMSRMPKLLRQKAFGEIDFVIIEGIGFTDTGELILSNSVGLVPSLVMHAKKVIIEINIAQPEELRGLHDIFMPEAPPESKPIPLVDAKDRIGAPTLKIDFEKIAFIIGSDQLDYAPFTKGKSNALTDNLMAFLEEEFENGQLLPLQTGFGEVTNNILAAFEVSDFNNLTFFCGGIVEGHIHLLRQNKVDSISTGSLQLTPFVIDQLKNSPALFKEKIVIRNTEMINNAELIGRLGIVALNTGIEVDIFGNVNSSHVLGNRVINGVGGGANFAQNAEISIVLIESLAKNGAISSIVPKVVHQDIADHDVDILITEKGIADLRGKDEIERAKLIIQSCADNAYQEALLEYLDHCIVSKGGHHPIDLEKCFFLHQKLEKNRTML